MFILVPNTSSYPVPDINSSKSVRGSTDMLASNGLRCSTDMLPSNGLRCSTDNLASNGLRCSTDVRLSDTDPQSVPLLQKETSFSVPQIIPHVQSNVQVARNGRIHSGRSVFYYYLSIKKNILEYVLIKNSKKIYSFIHNIKFT